MHQVPFISVLLVHLTSSTHVVLVKFSHPTDKSQPASETFVHGLRIKNTLAPGGMLEYEADLRSLVPAALNSLSPIKSSLLLPLLDVQRLLIVPFR